MYSNSHFLASSVSTPSKDTLKKVKTDYEGKISNMQFELKKLQNAQREHLRQQQKLKSHEVKINTLRSELNELKFTKVSLYVLVLYKFTMPFALLERRKCFI